MIRTRRIAWAFSSVAAAILAVLAQGRIARAADGDAPAPVLAPSPAASATPSAESAGIDPRLLGPATPARSDGALLLGPGAIVAAPRPAPARITRARALSMVAVPAGAVLAGGATWAGLVNQTGDAGTPALEMGAAYAGSWVATGSLGLAVWSFDADAFTPSTLRSPRDAPWLVAGSATLVPLAAGASTFFAAERLEGRSLHPWESFGGAVGGAAAGELLTSAASLLLHTPDAGNVELLAFVPVAAGAAIGYRLGHGHDARAKPLVHAPFVMVSARF